MRDYLEESFLVEGSCQSRGALWARSSPGSLLLPPNVDSFEIGRWRERRILTFVEMARKKNEREDNGGVRVTVLIAKKGERNEETGRKKSEREKRERVPH